MQFCFKMQFDESQILFQKQRPYFIPGADGGAGWTHLVHPRARNGMSYKFHP